MNEISLEEPQVQDAPQISLSENPGVAQSLPSIPVARNKAFKTTQGSGKTLKQEYNEIYNGMISGQEDAIRNQAAATQQYETMQKKQDALATYAAAKQGPLSSEEMTAVLDPFNKSSVTPDNVIERNYARYYASTPQEAAKMMPGTFLSKANTEIPEQVAKAQSNAEDIVYKMEKARSKMEIIDQEISNQSLLGWGADQLKNMFQPYVEYKTRGNVADVGAISGGILGGTNMQAQADRLLQLPPGPEFDRQFDAAVDYLRKDNLSLAKTFVEYVIGKSRNDRYLDNFFTVLGVSDYTALAKGGANLVKKGVLYAQTQETFKNIVKSAAEETPTKATVAEATGNLGESAVQSIVQNAKDGVSLKPEDTLFSGMRLDRTLLSTNPGSLSREQVVRLENSAKAASDKLESVTDNVSRVRRGVVPLDNEDAVRALKDDQRGLWRGNENAILDISDPVYHQRSNTYYFEHSLGTSDGNLFASPEIALNRAKDLHIADPKIVKAEGSVEAEAEKLVGSKTDIKRFEQLEREIPALEDTIKKWKTKLKNETDVAEKAKIKAGIKIFQEQHAKNLSEYVAIDGRVIKSAPRIEQQGVGYKIVTTKPLNETSNLYRDYLIGDPNAVSTAGASGVTAWRNAILNRVVGADNTLSVNETLQRKTAVYSRNVLQKYLEEQGEYIRQVSDGVITVNPVTLTPISKVIAKPRAWFGKIKANQVSKEFNSALDFARSAIDPVTKEPGYFFKTPGELDEHYLTYFDRPASFAEHEAYQAYTRMYEAERIWYEIMEFRNRSTRGFEQHQIFMRDADGKRVSSGFFDGVDQRGFPGGEGQILVLGERKGDEILYSLGSSSLSPQKLDSYKKLVDSGQARVIRLWDPDAHYLKEFSDIAGTERVRYVMVRDFETKPLDFNHVNRRGGGHFDYDYDHYIKQARVIAMNTGGTGNDKRTVFQHHYTGDTTVMPISNRVLGRDVIKKLEDVRQAIKDGNMELAESHAGKLPIPWEDLKARFEPGKDAKGRTIPAEFDKDMPFRLVPKNKKIYDLDKQLEDRYRNPKTGKTTFVDATKSGSDAQQFKVAYNTERDARGVYTIEDVGGKNNPVYDYVPAKLVDPIPTLNRSLQRAINSTFMDDYKMYAVEHWLREASPYLKANESEIRAAPFWHFMNESDDFKNIAAEDRSAVSNLKANRMKIKQFLGVPDRFDAMMDVMAQHLADGFYEKYGPEANRSAVDRVKIYPLRMISKVKDPTAYIRSMTFNFKLGLFNPAQFLVQAQSHATIIGLEPRHGTIGTFAMLLHQWGRFTENEAVLKALDTHATRLNGFGSKFRPGEFLEARRELEKSGFEHVAGEYAIVDDVSKPKFVKGEFGSFLSAGQVFFREGERSARLTAWYTSFRKFRDEHPTGALTQADRQHILNYADTLTNNMSRASSSILHGGPLSLTTQFLSYQIRSAELFLGKRLGATLAERNLARGRLVVMYSALYGAPTSLGISGFPFGDMIRQEAIDRGYTPRDNTWTTSIMEGIPAWGLAMATGNGNLADGKLYNVGNRYGSQGMTFLRDIFRTDSTILKILGGAGLSTTANLIASLDPFVQKTMGYFNGNDKNINITLEHFVKPFQEISSFNSAWKVYAALNTGKWLSKQEGYIGDVSKASAIFMGITGLSPQAQDDLYAKSSIRKDEEQYFKYIKKQFTIEHTRAIASAAAKDYDAAEVHHQNAKAWLQIGNVPTDMVAEFLSIANKSSTSQIDNSDYTFMNKNVPTKKWFEPDLPDARREQYRSTLKMDKQL